MRQRYLSVLLAAVTGVAMSGLLVAPAYALPTGRKANPAIASAATTVEGTVVSVAAGTITLRQSDGTTVTVTVGAGATITVDGAEVALAEIPAGARLRAVGTESRRGFVASQVEAATTWVASYSGAVSAVDAHSVTLGGGVTVGVSPAASVTVDGAMGTWTSLTPGSQVTLAGLETASGVRTAGTVTAVSAWDLRVTGTLSAVDPDLRTLTAETTTGPVTVEVAADAEITLDGAPIGLPLLPLDTILWLSGTEGAAGVRTVNRVEATTQPGTEQRPKRS
ncbi:hypothetical protein [Actinoplanes sp. NPDC051851]|uniref:hypothetical protein n=1 Tax=Actinoplanes sp. NPDC051851 TaxID=3154753 RepID=UPI00342A8A05